MRKVLAVFILLLAICSLTVAQEKAEVFAGYSFARLNTSVGSTNMNGWDAQLTGYLTKNFGITADINGAYKSESGATLKDHAFLFGPTFRVPSKKVCPFVHALFGLSHVTGSAFGESASDNAFATALGGGVDLMIGRGESKVGVRIAQFDYMLTTHGSENQNNFRYSTGVVFRF